MSYVKFLGILLCLAVFVGSVYADTVVAYYGLNDPLTENWYPFRQSSNYTYGPVNETTSSGTYYAWNINDQGDNDGVGYAYDVSSLASTALSNGFTLSSVLRMVGEPGDNAVCLSVNFSDNWFFMDMSQDETAGTVTVDLYNGSAWVSSGAITADTDDYHLYEFVYDPATGVDVFVDGVERISDQTAASHTFASGYIVIGSVAGGGSGSANYSLVRLDVPTSKAPVATVVETDGTTEVKEGETTDTFTVALNAQPADNVTVNLSDLSDPNQQVTVSPVSLSFTTSNWATAQTVTVQAIDDPNTEPLMTAQVGLEFVSNDPNFSIASPGFGYVLPVLALVEDNDTPLYVITEMNPNIIEEEGETTGTVDVSLGYPTTADVTVSVVYSGVTQYPNQIYEPDPNSLVFTPANYATPQTVTLKALDDDRIENDPHDTGVTFIASSTDTIWDGVEERIAIDIQENDCGAWGYSLGDVTGPEGVPDCEVDLLDFAVIASDWLVCTVPNALDCVDFR